MLTSSRSSAGTRENSRRKRSGSARAAMPGRRSRSSPPPAPGGAYRPSISSTVASFSLALRGRAGSAGHEQLVGHDLHRLRQVERAELRARRDVHQELAGEHLLVGEARRSRCRRRTRRRRPISIARAAAARASSTCGDHSRGRADSANAATQSRDRLRQRCMHRCGRRSTSTAFVAIHSASGAGKRSGATRRRSVRPMVFIARAAAPMLPGWLGRHSTMRIRSSAQQS